MLYPNRLQTALLFDRRVHVLDAIMCDFTRIEGMRTGARFDLSENDPDRFYRLSDAAGELMVTLEYRDRPADAQMFRAALSSPFTGIVTPGLRDRIGRSESHILFEVSHGVTGDADGGPDDPARSDAFGAAQAGVSQQQFEQRLAVLALIARIAIDHAMPLAVQWMQSDMLLSGERFDAFAAAPATPGPLHIHPLLFGQDAATGQDALVGIRTQGVHHWLGREIIVQPNVLPWAAHLETIFAFLRVATMANGYVIPDGNTFGPEDGGVCYRVIHHDKGADIGFGGGGTEPADMPLYELVPLTHLAQNPVAPDHTPDTSMFAAPAFPADILPANRDAPMARSDDRPENRTRTEGIGERINGHAAAEADTAARLQPSAPGTATSPGQPGLPAIGVRGLRPRVFGRKGL